MQSSFFRQQEISESFPNIETPDVVLHKRLETEGLADVWPILETRSGIVENDPASKWPSGAGPQTVATVAGLLGPSLDNPEIGNITNGEPY